MSSTIQLNQNNVSCFTYTSSTITPSQINAFPANNPSGVTDGRRTSSFDYGSNTGGTQACTGLEFVVLKMPCAFGHMSGYY